jgi:Zn-dependent metalloprotease
LTLASLLLAAPLPATARTWLDLDTSVQGDPGTAVLAFVRSQPRRFGHRGGELRATVTPLRGGSVVRLTQVLRGRPVHSAELAVLVLGGRAIAATGELATIERELGREALSEGAARVLVAHALAGATVHRSAAAVRVRRGEARPVWIVDASRVSPPGAWRVVVDAESAELLESASRLRFAGAASIYPANPTLTSLKQVTLEGLESTTELRGVHADVVSCGSAQGKVSCERLAKPDLAGDFLYQPNDPSVSDPFVEANAYYHVDLFHRWLAKRFLFARKGKQQIQVLVNYHTETSSGSTQGLYNAFYGDGDGDGAPELVFGQGSRDFAYDADVIYHEFTHSAIAETSDFSPVVDDLGFNLMPLALGEAFADLFSSTFLDDPNVGDYAGGKSALRSLAGTAVRCPDDLSGEEHQDGLIWGRAAWAVRAGAPSKEVFEDVLYTTMAALTSHATVADTAKLFEKVAQQTSAPLAQVASGIIAARSLTSCERIVPLVEGKQRTGWTYGTSIGMTVVPAPMQYKIVVPLDATRLQVNAKASAWMGATGTIGAFIRRDQPVVYAGSKSTYDVLLLNGQNSAILDVGDPEQPLTPGATYYVLPVNVGANETMYRISYGLLRATPDAGPPGADLSGTRDLARGELATGRDAGQRVGGEPAPPSEGSGCTCAVASGAESPAFALALALAALALGRLRASRRRERRGR